MSSGSSTPPQQLHTRFLDLTDGGGGEHQQLQQHQQYQHHPDDLDDGLGGGGDDEDDFMDETPPTSEQHERRVRSVSTSIVDPSTPGRVVETGQEHTGRWTKEEHEAFLSALQLYGKEWKKVAAKVKTRTVVQTRTHAQKYFQKLQKTMDHTGSNTGTNITGINITGMEDFAPVDMGSSVAVAVAMKPRKAGQTAEKKKPRKTPSVHIPIPSTNKLNRRSSSSMTLSAAQVISNMSNPAGPVRVVADGSSNPMPARHGFSSSIQAGEQEDAFPLFATTTSHSSTSGWIGNASSMKILVPDPSSSLQQMGFPEPSPAATGKRKLAEIAAARMLAGVGGVDSEGPPTPPPTMEKPLNLKDAPTLPIFGQESKLARAGLSLQIVNPATLGVTYQEQDKRRRGGDNTSPVTPWDGQLQALVYEKQAAEDQREAALALDSSSPVATTTNGHVQSKLHPVCGPGSAFRRNPLHNSVCDGDVTSVRQQLEIVVNRGEGVLQKVDDAGFCPLHSACALGLLGPGESCSSTGSEIVEILLGAGADAAQTDSDGNSPLHWAARSGDRDSASKLLLKNCPLDGKNRFGDTPLHWAMRAGRRGMEVTAVLIENGARATILNKEFRRPVDVAGEGFLDDVGSLVSLKLRDELGKKVGKNELKRVFKVTALDRRDSRANLLIRSPASRTLVLHHPECLEHHPKSEADWEAPDRITSIMRRVLPSSDSTGATETSGVFPHEITVTQEFDRASLDLLSRVHSTEYLSFVNQLSKDLEQQMKETTSVDESSDSLGSSSKNVVPFTPLVQRSMTKIDEDRVKLGSNSDTAFSAGSLKAARRAAGAVQHAVDW
jgi:SHAQKYF class myb-like DNA-binding protein